MSKGKIEIAQDVAERLGLTRDQSLQAVTSVFDSIGAELRAGGMVRIVGFGTFQVKTRKASQGRNPRTGEAIQIAEKQSAAFRGSKTLLIV